MHKTSDNRETLNHPEIELWSAFLDGDEEALGNIFVRYYNRLFLYGMNLTESRSEVQDAIQELFLKLWRNRGSLKRAESVEYYLLHALRRMIFRQKNKNASIARLNRKYMEEHIPILVTIEEQTIQREKEKERQELFLRVYQNLSDREREVLYLRLQHGLTNREIASILDLSVQRVKNCIYEGIRNMREEISRLVTKKD